MTICQILATLAREPFHIEPRAALRLTPFQVRTILTPPDELGKETPVISTRDMWQEWGFFNKLRPYMVRKRMP